MPHETWRSSRSGRTASKPSATRDTAARCGSSSGKCASTNDSSSRPSRAARTCWAGAPIRRRGAARSWRTAGSATEPVIPVAIALGSNLGDRASHLAFAVEHLRTAIQHLSVSSFVDTDPVGVGVQPVFLNGAVAGSTTLSARQLLERLLTLERERGRHRPYEGAPRTLDLDLVLYGTAIINEPGLTVPHPRFRDRAFVLGPLSEIAGAMQDPVTGLTVLELWQRIRP